MMADPILSISVSLSDPVGASPLVAAVLWLEQTLLGTIARTVAILAVSSVGFMMAFGRVNFRYGATVIIGCFIVFGATSIVAGMQAAVSGSGSESLMPAPIAAVPAPVAIPADLPVGPRKPGSDPYAGASVPLRSSRR